MWKSYAPIVALTGFDGVMSCVFRLQCRGSGGNIAGTHVRYMMATCFVWHERHDIHFVGAVNLGVRAGHILQPASF